MQSLFTIVGIGLGIIGLITRIRGKTMGLELIVLGLLCLLIGFLA
ncbi:hypothetical protein SAMN05444487_103198 [Marininema mesophilum]|uniref:Uncharacterized protein n=1 Tax=Marininema mesophilum TaxID=1048340 RepID=A0A1H2TQH7_9BACL|nr:hypothetical protein [Marininema mesophilum]SDW45529.1 hypothetical protein SAMN05444487_103198 [Marininema mesophilum]